MIIPIIVLYFTNFSLFRTRHIKCDEGRPICSLCTKGGLVCEYRQTPDGRTRASRKAKSSTVGTQVRAVPNAHKLNLHILGSQVELNCRERYFLNFFRTSTSLQCAGYFQDDFWEVLVHQASEDRPAIRHAVIGMGCLNWQFTQRTSRMRLPSGQRAYIDPFSLQQINKAIASLQQSLNEDSTGRLQVETALVACVVLVSTLLFQEDAILAGRHLCAGYKLLDQYLRSHGSTSLIAATITRAFGVAHLSWRMFANTTYVDEEPLPLIVPEAWTEGGDDIQRANDLVVTLARISSVQSWFKGFDTGSDTPDLEIDQNAFVAHLQSLPGQLQAYRDIYTQGPLTRRYMNALLILQLWVEICSLTSTVETCPGQTEMLYDGYIEQFKRAIQFAQDLLMNDTLAPTFSINIGVLPPLWLLAMKCRDWATRREAIILLLQWHRQEGIWHTDFMALVAARVIDIESAGFSPGDHIPFSSRVRSLRIDLVPNKPQVRLWYHFARGCSNVCKHTEPWENELLLYTSGRFEVIETSMYSSILGNCNEIGDV